MPFYLRGWQHGRFRIRSRPAGVAQESSIVLILAHGLAKHERGLLTPLWWPYLSVTLVFSYQNIQTYR